ncbi:hypothetical protein WAI453_010324 [Rhynchosporium graminicola]
MLSLDALFFGLNPLASSPHLHHERNVSHHVPPVALTVSFLNLIADLIFFMISRHIFMEQTLEVTKQQAKEQERKLNWRFSRNYRLERAYDEARMSTFNSVS